MPVWSNQKEARPRVSIFFWEGYLGVAPSLLNALQMFSSRGYDVDVLMRPSPPGFPAPPTFSGNVRIRQCYTLGTLVRRLMPNSLESVEWTNVSATTGRRDRRAYNFFKKYVWRNAYWTVWFIDHIMFTVFSIIHIWHRRYACFIGVDRDGLFTATVAGVVKRRPVLCWSLEIRFADEAADCVQRKLKGLERVCLQRVERALIQDRKRADAFLLENGMPSSRIMIVPNGPLGQPGIISSGYLQKVLSLDDPSSLIVLHLGMISPAFLSLELSKNAANWPKDWLLVFHERQKRERGNPYLESVLEAGRGHAALSLDPVPYNELDKVVSSAKVGVVLYQKELGRNFSLAGSSGKLGQYFRCGVPVVCLDLPGIAEVVDKYGCGICVKEVYEMEAAIQSILKNYGTYSTSARTCYREAYEFGVHFNKVLVAIDRLREVAA